MSAGLSLTAGALIGQSRELLAFLNSAETRSRTRVISAPFNHCHRFRSGGDQRGHRCADALLAGGHRRDSGRLVTVRQHDFEPPHRRQPRQSRRA
jgi:hypothetical protein